MKKLKRLVTGSAVLALSAVCAASASASVVVFNDTFASGTAADSGYYRFGTANTSLAVDGVNAELDFAYSSDASSRSGVIKSFAEQTLAVGDSITFAFDFNSRLINSSENHTFRWGIGNLGNPTSVTGVPVTADLSSSTPFTDGTRQMYQFSASSSATAGFAQYVTGSSSPVHNQSGSATAITDLTGPANISNSGAASVTLTITRTATGFDFAQTAFGSSDTGSLTGGTEIFNTIAFSMNNAGSYNVALDNVSVTYTAIPEPGSLALLGLGGLMMLGRRRVS